MKLPDKVIEILAADLAAVPEQLSSGQVQVVEFKITEGRRNFPIRTPHLHALSLGWAQGTVISASSDLQGAVRSAVPGMSEHSDIFSGPGLSVLRALLPADMMLYGPDLKYICAQPRRGPKPEGYRLQVYAANFPNFGSCGCFTHALSSSPERPNVLAMAALYSGQVAGLAAASADNDLMWQIGVDVLPGHRGRGVARWLVAELTGGILERDRIPYYSTTPGNIASQRVAAAAGFVPAWVEVYG